MAIVKHGADGTLITCYAVRRHKSYRVHSIFRAGANRYTVGLCHNQPRYDIRRTRRSGRQRLRVRATDQGSVRDFQVFAQQSGHQLLESTEADGVYTHILEKRQAGK